MLLPSGPANTRCSVCRCDAGGLHVQLQPAPGTGLQSPETGSQNRRYRDLSWRQRPHVPHLNPRKCPQIAGYSSETGKRRFALDCVVGLRGLKLRVRHAALSTSLRPRTDIVRAHWRHGRRVLGRAERSSPHARIAAPRRATRPPIQQSILCRKDWISCVNIAVLYPSGPRRAPGSPAGCMAQGGTSDIGDWNVTERFSGIQILAWRTIGLSARTKPTIDSRQR